MKLRTKIVATVLSAFVAPVAAVMITAITTAFFYGSLLSYGILPEVSPITGQAWFVSVTAAIFISLMLLIWPDKLCEDAL